MIFFRLKNIHVFLVAFIFLFNGYAIVVKGQDHGLRFLSHEVPEDERTSLDLDLNKQLCGKAGFDLSFKLSYSPGLSVYFGYVTRIIVNDNRNIDLVYDDSKATFNVVIGDRITDIVLPVTKDVLFKSWINLKMQVDVEHDRLLVYYAGKTHTAAGLGLKKGDCFNIIFGAVYNGNFETRDLPPMKLKDIVITTGGEQKYNWPLNEFNGTVIHDKVNNAEKKVFKPSWLLARNYYWEKLTDFVLDGVPAAAFDKKKGKLYIVNHATVYQLDIASNTLKKTPNKTNRVINTGTQAVFDHFNNNLYTYYQTQQAISRYDSLNRDWSHQFEVSPPNNGYMHANKFVCKTDSCIYFVGGYGLLTYKNDVFKYSLTKGTWQKLSCSGDFFTPRYLAGLGATAQGDTAYILGGYGNTSGKQIQNPKYLYDLLRFTTRDRKFTKLGELKVDSGDFVLANSLIIDSDAKKYFGLIFPKQKFRSALQLVSGSFNKNSVEYLGDTIPYQFHDEHSFAELFYSPQLKCYVTVTLYTDEKSNKTTVKVYRLLGPPYNASLAANKNIRPKTGSHLWLYLVAAALVGGLLAFFVLRRKKTVQQPAPVKPIAPIQAATPVTPQPITAGVKESVEPVQPARSKNAVFLFGELQVFDKNGTDITKYFSPLIKELFLVILLYSIRWGRGLSSDKLVGMLWGDKSEKSARNNRSVSIAKLKTILENVDGAALSKASGNWTLTIDHEQLSVDYYDYLNIVTTKKDGLSKDKILRLSAITQRGLFLTNTDYEWLESFKSKISNEVINTYLAFANATGINEDADFLVEVADFIFHYDSVNEEAMVLKCKALSFLGKHSLALHSFEVFCKEYKNIYDEDYPKAFQSILHS